MPPQTEDAVKFRYDLDNSKWYGEKVQVRLTSEKVGEGGMRSCFTLIEVEDDGSQIKYMAKFFKRNIQASRDTYFHEAAGQYIADKLAQDYNRLGTPKKVAFVNVNVLEFQRPEKPLCTIEPVLQGNYAKHNNNYGANFTADETASAFSHFTWEASHHEMLVCDIQGVGEFYTDPQIHTHNGEGFGMGNLGEKGIAKFLQSHVCNSICRQLQLPGATRAPVHHRHDPRHDPSFGIQRMYSQLTQLNDVRVHNLAGQVKPIDLQRQEDAELAMALEASKKDAAERARKNKLEEDHELRRAIERSLMEEGGGSGPASSPAGYPAAVGAPNPYGGAPSPYAHGVQPGYQQRRPPAAPAPAVDHRAPAYYRPDSYPPQHGQPVRIVAAPRGVGRR